MYCLTCHSKELDVHYMNGENRRSLCRSPS
jgi:hypothetical protein